MIPPLQPQQLIKPKRNIWFMAAMDEPEETPYVPATIICVDCGGTCGLLTAPPTDEYGATGFKPGDVVAYRCRDCLDRWDLVVE